MGCLSSREMRYLIPYIITALNRTQEDCKFITVVARKRRFSKGFSWDMDIAIVLTG